MWCVMGHCVVTSHFNVKTQTERDEKHNMYRKKDLIQQNLIFSARGTMQRVVSSYVQSGKCKTKEAF